MTARIFSAQAQERDLIARVADLLVEHGAGVLMPVQPSRRHEAECTRRHGKR